MPTTDFSGRDVVRVLSRHRFTIEDRTGSHVKLRFENADTDEVRIVTVPMHDRVRLGTLRSIAEQSGAEDFDSWCRWIDRNR